MVCLTHHVKYTKKVMKESMLPVWIMMKQVREAASAGVDGGGGGGGSLRVPWTSFD